ncbi:MAG: dipeptidase [Alphaproteobacteria bacterium]|nr:dipeptidase [Alphaproteobacteria bacterium]
MKTNQFLNEHKVRFLDELFTILKIPSISAQSNHKNDMLICAKTMEQFLKEAGVKTTKIYETAGHPIVYGEHIINPNLPTILVYGHYDVQPVEPLNLWLSPPFEPTIRDGKIYARGACDDKGQVFMHIKAFEAMIQTDCLCTNVKFIIEGEEEIGSPNLGNFIVEHKKLLSSDVILISDTSMLSLENPSIDVGVRGLTYIEVEITGPNRDLHSGVYGGAVANPITILAQIIASCHDKNNKITIPGFYDDVLEMTADERALIAQIPFNLEDYKQQLDILEDWGEKGYSTIERTGSRPTLELNGIWGGYTAEGAKTVLPSKAFAKISCRLIPHQKSYDITTKLINYLKSQTPPSVKIECKVFHGGEPYITPLDSIVYKAGELAIEEVFGKKPIPVRGGGSIPICALFEKELGTKIMFLGFGLDDDGLHSPNEKFNIDNFYKGIETIPYFYKHFAALKNN